MVDGQKITLVLGREEYAILATALAYTLASLNTGRSCIPNGPAGVMLNLVMRVRMCEFVEKYGDGALQNFIRAFGDVMLNNKEVT